MLHECASERPDSDGDFERWAEWPQTVSFRQFVKSIVSHTLSMAFTIVFRFMTLFASNNAYHCLTSFDATTFVTLVEQQASGEDVATLRAKAPTSIKVCCRVGI